MLVGVILVAAAWAAVAQDAMPKREILRARWRADRVRLDEPEPLDGRPQSERRKEAARDGESAEIVERHTAAPLPARCSARGSSLL